MWNIHRHEIELPKNRAWAFHQAPGLSLHKCIAEKFCQVSLKVLEKSSHFVHACRLVWRGTTAGWWKRLVSHGVCKGNHLSCHHWQEHGAHGTTAWTGNKRVDASASSYRAAGFALNCCQQRHSCTHYSSCMEDVRHRCIKYSDRALILQIALLDSRFESSELMPTLSNSSFYET